jgi:ADP-ribose pyrophosphatase YjhB (NUDIX family)
VPATAAVVRDDDGNLLLVKRGTEPGKGKWCLPGGFPESDKLPVAGVLRELHEETGVAGLVQRLLSVCYEDSPFYGPLVIIGYNVVPGSGRLEAGDDAADVAYFPFDDLPPIAFDAHRQLITHAIEE